MFTKEQKQLLLKDLCGRLPYGVMVENILNHKIFDLSKYLYCLPVAIENFKPYLRPMSSMMEKEEEELSRILNYEFYIDDDFALAAEDDRHRIRLELCDGYIDWLNEHHFDYRGLIEKGLALEAPEGMYKIE